MSAGHRPYRIAIEQPTPGQDAVGAPTETPWALLGYVWSSKEPAGGSERFVEDRVHAEVDYRFRMLSTPTTRAITPGMRIRHGSKVYDIRSAVDPDGRRREIEIVATERVA